MLAENRMLVEDRMLAEDRMLEEGWRLAEDRMFAEDRMLEEGWRLAEDRMFAEDRMLEEDMIRVDGKGQKKCKGQRRGLERFVAWDGHLKSGSWLLELQWFVRPSLNGSEDGYE